MARAEVGARVTFRGRVMAGFVVMGLSLAAMLVATDSEAATAILHSFAPGPAHPQAPLVADEDGNLYGTTRDGGASDLGTVFKIKTDGSGFAVLHSFAWDGANGAFPIAGLTLDDLGNLYGTTLMGGASDLGTVFTIKTDGSGFAVLHFFGGGAADGAGPTSSLVAGRAGNLYGTTEMGGASDLGTVFTIKTDGSGFAVLHSFSGSPTDGRTPSGGLVAGSAGSLYGTTAYGGAFGQGTVYTINTDGSGFALLHAFSGGAADGTYPAAELLADGANLYGTTLQGGTSNWGTVFTVRTDGLGFAVLHSFSGGADGGYPMAGLVAGGAGSLYGTTWYGGASDFGAIYSITRDGSGFVLLHSFTGSPMDGRNPVGHLVIDGARLYGTTTVGGTSGSGTVFTVNSTGVGFSLLSSFAGGAAGGRDPFRGLVADGAGNFYGTTYWGGASDLGGVFTIKNDGSGFAVLHSFAGWPDGRNPYAGLAIDGAGDLYGTTSYGGASDWGSVFTVKTDGSGLILLHSFTWGSEDGRNPTADLARDADGNLYGTTCEGGAAADHGTVFAIKAEGWSYSLLHSFTGGPGGDSPTAGLVVDGAGNLYGTTRGGGASGWGTVFTIRNDGSSFAVLHSFAGSGADGCHPEAGLLADGAGNLYGATADCGASNEGTIFSVRTDGTGFAVLHTFAGGIGDGAKPHAGLVADGAGNLFGTTSEGGASNLGTVFTLKTDGSGFALLHAFAGPPSDGSAPFASLVRRGRALYGTTRSGGAADEGTVFALVNPLWKGRDTPGIYRDSDRQWYLKNTNAPGTSDLEFPYGDPSDLAVVGDWDGDGIDTIGVYRPAEAAWFLKNSNAGGAPDLAFTYGLTDETPVVGDWNGDGLDTVGIFRASDRQWYLHNTNASGDAEVVFPYGDPATDVPIVGDWDNDGTDTVGVYRPAQGEWFLKNTNAAGNADLNFTYGILNEKPVVGDWDGN
jgi:uncharacterized repeat protein (TIGR03803 family)